MMDANVSSIVYNTQPYEHQIDALNRAWLKPAFAYFLEMGTGKSKIIIDEIINLVEKQEINCAIILAPNNVHINWKGEFIKHWPNYNKIAIQIWRSGLSEIARGKFENETRTIINSNKTLIFLMNIEALSTKSGQEYLRRILLARRMAYVAIDESHKIKNPAAIRTKAAIWLGGLAKYKRLATGTEAEEGLENLFSQFRFLDASIVGSRSYTAFKSMYCIMGGYENREIKGYQNEKMLAAKIAPYIYSKRKKDCLDLPDKVYVTHEIGLTAEQHRICTQLEEELIYELSNGQIVDATLALTRMVRIQQVLCGHINAPPNESESTRYAEVIPSHRADYVAELIENANSKVIVFCRFIKDVELIISACAKRDLSGIGISSLVEGSRRLDEINRWRRDPSLKVLAITTSTGGTGLTLNEAKTTIFYSNSWSSTDRIQAEDRNHRIGQESKVTYHDIIVRNKIDHRLLLALKNKQTSANWFRSIVDIQRFMTEDISE